MQCFSICRTDAPGNSRALHAKAFGDYCCSSSTEVSGAAFFCDRSAGDW